MGTKQAPDATSHCAPHLSRGLVVVAAPKEWVAVARGLGVLHDTHNTHDSSDLSGVAPTSPPVGSITQSSTGWDIVRCGAGKTHAAIATCRSLAERNYKYVLSLGIAGALPRTETTAPLTTPLAPPLAPPLALGSIVVGTRCELADEGVQCPDTFVGMGSMSFGVELPRAQPNDQSSVTDAVRPCTSLSDALVRALSEHKRAQPVVAGIIATVSTCAGTDGLAQDRSRRTGAVCEAMEGAAVVLAARWHGTSAAEIRVLSNTTGDRHQQVWDLELALARLEEAASGLPAPNELVQSVQRTP